jgi:hypothetical protein
MIVGVITKIAGNHPPTENKERLEIPVFINGNFAICHAIATSR